LPATEYEEEYDILPGITISGRQEDVFLLKVLGASDKHAEFLHYIKSEQPFCDYPMVDADEQRDIRLNRDFHVLFSLCQVLVERR
jgi:hypothetical protein